MTIAPTSQMRLFIAFPFIGHCWGRMTFCSVVLLTGFWPGTCDMVRVVLCSDCPSVLVFVLDLLNVPLSTAWAFVCAFSLSSLSLSCVLLIALPSSVAALPPDPMEEVVPSSV